VSVTVFFTFILTLVAMPGLEVYLPNCTTCIQLTYAFVKLKAGDSASDITIYIVLRGKPWPEDAICSKDFQKTKSIKEHGYNLVKSSV